MAERIEYYAWRESDYGIQKSVREYDKYEVHAQKVEDRWNESRLETLTLYIDEKTGIATTNIEAFETWTGDLKED